MLGNDNKFAESVRGGKRLSHVYDGYNWTI